MTDPHLFAIHLKDSPSNPSQGVEAYYYAKKFQVDAEGRRTGEVDTTVVKDSELPAEVKAKLDDAFASVLAYLATL